MAGEDEDRINSLPSDVIVSILSRLPLKDSAAKGPAHGQLGPLAALLKDAVRTSALARSGRHLWTFRPSLTLGCSGDPLGDTRDSGDSGPVASSWIERVHHVVSSLRGPLLHFVLSHRFSSHQFALLQRLLDLLLQKGSLQKLHLTTGCVLLSDLVVIHLPSFQSLQNLQLYGCRIVLPTGFQGLERLHTLALENVQISNEDLHLLIHISNNLTGLKAFDFLASENHTYTIKLNLPLLRYLQIRINNSVRKAEVVSAPCLKRAYIGSYARSDFKKIASMNLGLMTSAVMVSSLHLAFDVLKSLSLVALPSNFTFPRLTHLKLFLNVGTMDRDKMTFDTFIWLLQSMPFLKVLDLQLHDYDYYINKDRVDILMRGLLVNKHDGISCLDRTLKSVRIKMHTLNSDMTIITLVKFLLLNARVLELMKVAYWTGSEVDPSMLEVLQNAKLTTSSKAEVVISECNC
ncbi:F-box/RNI-like superfamily protein [Rhynchospora pubera]|uniref:F-box/RNI-like superfamily protein n=1 Tax=Rhynchospora pubera TaxID=906938 RepID=A0AAV8C2B3_9POAL|nr:F-box/RNI-like superfamily protein [Rhynchospora pubera]